MANPSTLARVRRFVETYVRKGPFVFYPEEAVVENVIVGLANHLEEHGKMYCPCAPIEDSKAKGAEMVCPCTPHRSDIARQGYCDCALFASPAFVAEERLRRSKE
jgi:ferredoxin-thioredoxin reductase catalytic chain